MKTQRRVASYEELVAGRYGAGDGRGRKGPRNAAELFAGYYGHCPKRAERPSSKVETLSFSASESLTQSRNRRSKPFSDSIAPAAPQPVANGTLTGAPAASQAPPSEEERVREEEKLDLFAGTVPGASAPSEPGKAAIEPAAVTFPSPSQPAQPVSGAQSRLRRDDDFMSDMKSILSGQQAYDMKTKTMVPRSEFPQPPEARNDPMSPPSSQPSPQVPPPGGGHEIFERIAQSLEYAGAYDLGSVDLENRFNQFDKEREGKGKSPSAPLAPPLPEPQKPHEVARSPADEFREDINDMLARPQPVVPPSSPPPPEPMAAAAPDHDGEVFFPDPDTMKIGALAPDQSRPAAATATSPQSLPDGTVVQPFYASGEHILAASGLYPGTFQVGQAPGVALGYSEIVAMADLYEKVEDLKKAPVAELTQLKRLLAQDTGHYTPGVNTPAPTDDDWDNATGDRYSRLAEDNYEHFAPNVLFQDPRFAAKVPPHRDHRSAWEESHLQAMNEVRALNLAADAPMTASGPLVTNAFGDHFLTDAFAAGHIISKQVIFNIFETNFYTGGKLNAAGEDFMKGVASMAWSSEHKDAHGRTLADKFKVLESYEPLDRWWNIVSWHPNITNADRFASLLIEIGNRQREKVANLAVKAIHDKLNKEGIGVVNGMGKTWTLTGDGHLSEDSRLVMQDAIRQSIANIQDHAIRVAGFDPKPFMAKVWAHVPQLSAAGAAWARQYVPQIVHPLSGELRFRTQKLLTDEVDLLIRKLLDPKNKALRKA